MLLPLTGMAAVRYHCPQDSAKVVKVIEEAAKGNSYGERIVAAAKSLEGIPRGKAADNDSVGSIVIRLDSLNQRELIYTALAAAKTAELAGNMESISEFGKLPLLREFEKNMEDISRRKGVDDGFLSQFFYGSDWIVDNVYRGNLKEMTEYLEGGGSKTKTLDYVSRHPDEFPALSDPEILEKVKIVEFGYKSHRIPHLKKQSIGNKIMKELLQNGDILIMNPPETDFDIYDIGIVSMEKGEPYLIHISRETNEVRLDPYPLTRLFKIEGQFFYGYRWLRPVE